MQPSLVQFQASKTPPKVTFEHKAKKSPWAPLGIQPKPQIGKLSHLLEKCL